MEKRKNASKYKSELISSSPSSLVYNDMFIDKMKNMVGNIDNVSVTHVPFIQISENSGDECDCSKIISNIKSSDEDYYNVVLATLNVLKNSLIKSFGPYGSTTIVENRLKNHQITKDGYKIINSIFFRDDISNTILDLIKNTSKALVRTVGDGTTSAIVFSALLYERLFHMVSECAMPPKDVVKILDELSKEFRTTIKEDAIEIVGNEDKLKDIATIASNNDSEIGELIYSVYKEIGLQGNINIDISSSDKTYYTVNNGFEVTRGFIDRSFINKDEKSFESNEITNVFICDGELSSREGDIEFLSFLMNKSMTGNTPLVIVAKSYDPYVKGFLVLNKRNLEKLSICAIDFSTVSPDGSEKLKDLAMYIGAKIYSKTNKELLFNEMIEMSKNLNINDYMTYSKLNEKATSVLGHCGGVKITQDISKFFYGTYNEDIDNRIKSLEEKIKKLSDSNKEDANSDIKKLKKRISNIKGTMATIFVGGDSIVEKETKEYLIEDAVYACKSAISNGFIVGGCLTIPMKYYVDLIKYSTTNPIQWKKINKKLYNIIESTSEKTNVNIDIIYKVIYLVVDSILSIYKSVVYNSNRNGDFIIKDVLENKKIYNLINNSYETVEETSVISSAETDCEIIKSAFSIVSLLVTSNQFLTLGV